MVRSSCVAIASNTSGQPPVFRLHQARTVVDGSGRFLTPGLIDMHTHVSKTRGSSLSLLVAARRHHRARSRRGSRGAARLAPRDRRGHTDRPAAAHRRAVSRIREQRRTPARDARRAKWSSRYERTRIGVGTPCRRRPHRLRDRRTWRRPPQDPHDDRPRNVPGDRRRREAARPSPWPDTSSRIRPTISSRPARHRSSTGSIRRSTNVRASTARVLHPFGRCRRRDGANARRARTSGHARRRDAEAPGRRCRQAA